MLGKRLGIDLGTANSLVWLAGPPNFSTQLFRTVRSRLVLQFLAGELIKEGNAW